MVSWSSTQAVAHEVKIAAGKRKPAANQPDAAGREIGRGGLHEQIIRHCDSQWPRWKFIHLRTDKKSTAEEGAHDFTIFLPKKWILCIECKSKTGKLTDAQRNWAHEMGRLGHVVHEVRSFQAFLKLTIAFTTSQSDAQPSG